MSCPCDICTAVYRGCRARWRPPSQLLRSNRPYPLIPIALDHDGVMPDDIQGGFRALHRQFDDVFDPHFRSYNGAAGPFKVKVNMGPVQPPQRKGRVPQYSRGQLQELQAQFDALEEMGVFKRPEGVGVTVEYVNPSFLIKKTSGGFHLGWGGAQIHVWGRAKHRAGGRQGARGN